MNDGGVGWERGAGFSLWDNEPTSSEPHGSGGEGVLVSL